METIEQLNNTQNDNDKQIQQNPTLNVDYKLNVDDMFQLLHNEQFGLKYYYLPKKYFGHSTSPQKPKQSEDQKKSRNDSKTTYLKAIEKQQKNMPAPNTYHIAHDWVTKEQLNKYKVVQSAIQKNSKSFSPSNQRPTLFSQIMRDSIKHRLSPGPGAYMTSTVNKSKNKPSKAGTSPTTAAQKLKEQKYDETILMCNMSYQKVMNPGPGNYNPRLPTKKLHENVTKIEDWRKKHSEAEDKIKKKKASPDPASYQPIPVIYQTFQKIFQVQGIKNKNRSKSGEGNKIQGKGFGTSPRNFYEVSKDKKKARDSSPGPGQYDLIARWDQQKADLHQKNSKKNWAFAISKGIQKNIYYE